ncbi:MAG: hypothetical protein IPF68_20425 [Bacteroidales bacterium]|nr:hypothetical protein [Bacteroidales bacterium]
MNTEPVYRYAFSLPKRLLTGALLVLCIVFGGAKELMGQISINAYGTTFTQDFNTLAYTGATSAVLPAGWALFETDTNADALYGIGDGSSATGDSYSFGNVANAERAFGGLRSSSLNPTIGANFINNTGGTIAQLSISYTGEQWRLGAINRLDRLDFQYSLDATSLTTGEWSDFDLLDFIAPVTTGATGARNGNIAPNRTFINELISNLYIPNGGNFWIRWNDFDPTGSDDGLPIDDFSIAAIDPCDVFVSSFIPSTGPEGTLVTINGQISLELHLLVSMVFLQDI